MLYLFIYNTGLWTFSIRWSIKLMNEWPHSVHFGSWSKILFVKKSALAIKIWDSLISDFDVLLDDMKTILKGLDEWRGLGEDPSTSFHRDTLSFVRQNLLLLLEIRPKVRKTCQQRQRVFSQNKEVVNLPVNYLGVSLFESRFTDP